MEKTYIKMKTLVESVTGYCLPEVMPAIGMQADIPIPYFDIYEQWEPARFVYLGGEKLYLNSPTTKEVYKFDGLQSSYNDYKESALLKREQERFIRVRQSYEKAEVVKPAEIAELSSLELHKVVNFQKGMVNEEIAPIGIGELRMFESNIYQAFYSEYIESSQEYKPYEEQIPKVVAIRELSSSQPLEYSPNLPFCQHIHRLIHTMPCVWVVGYESAIQALKRLPDFTVKEAFSLEFLINTAIALADERDRANKFGFDHKKLLDPSKTLDITTEPHSTAFKSEYRKELETWFALTPKQLKTFNSKLEEKGLEDFESLPFTFILLGEGEHE